MKLEYNLEDGKTFLEVARDNCRSTNLHLSFAIYLSHIAKGIFERYNRNDFVEESEAVIERARARIKREYRVRVFEEISAIKNDAKREMMYQQFFQSGDVLVTECMKDNLLEDKRFKELLDLCLGDESDLEATITAYELFLGRKNAA